LLHKRAKGKKMVDERVQSHQKNPGYFISMNFQDLWSIETGRKFAEGGRGKKKKS